jgi:carbonic anhydrase/acetyltransferase-like protein (isoleucine patch superfamily)
MPLYACNDHSPRIHPTAFVADGAVIAGNVTLEEDASIWFNAVVRGDINSILIGQRTNIQDGCVLHVTNTFPVRIGKDVTVGHRAVVHGCIIEDESLVGMGAVILDNAHIGPNVLVAAGALVLEGVEVPGGSLAAGVPARVIRKLTDAEKDRIRSSARHYVEYAKSFAR